jgi:hypothetical protein
MQGRYYTHAAFLKGGAAAAADPRAAPGRVGGRDVRPGRLASRADLRALRPRQPRVRRRRQASYESSADYQAHVYDMVETDLDEALMPSAAARSRRPRR